MDTSSDIEVRELGFTLLSDPVQPGADVFFVHGLQGHPRNTWAYSVKGSRVDRSPSRRQALRNRFNQAFRSRSGNELEVYQNRNDQVFWPHDLLCESFPTLRVFTYGYDSHVTHWFNGPAMQLDILSHGESLLSGIAARRIDDPKRPLILVVHSLGGLLIKDVLRRARGSTDPRYKNIYSAVSGIIFFGTPHHGGNYINMGLTARKIVAASGLDTSDKLLRDLKFDSTIAKMLSEEFTQFLHEREPLVYTFQEASGLSGFGPLSGKVVDDVSSSLEYPLQFKDHIYANHMDMCRFSGPEDDGYLKVSAAIGHILSGNTQAATQAQGLYQKVLGSLFLRDHEERLNQVEKAYDGTFEWLYGDTVPFTEWLRQGNGIFWISGKPASGKSTLLKFAVSDSRTYEYLNRNNSVNRWITGDFFFSNRGKEEQRCVEGLLQRILFQLLSQTKELLPFIQRMYLEHAQHHGWLLIYLEDAFKNIIQQRKVPINICLFIDALDEQTEGYYQNHATLLNYLRSLSERADGKIVRLLLCLTSRPENIFVDGLRGYPGFRIHEHTQGDIGMYVNNQLTDYLHSRSDLSSDTRTTQFFHGLCIDICRRAEGVFLWVKLVVIDIIEGLRSGDAPTTLQDKLRTLPGDGDLQQLYAEILLRLTPNYLHEAYLMLWIAYSSNEPMPLVEFFQAKGLMMLGDQSYDWASPPVAQMELQLLSRCRGFLEIQYSFTRDEQGREYHGPFVQFLHQSVKDFLRDSDSFDKIRNKLKVRFPSSRALDENGYAYLLRFRVSQHFRKYGNSPHQIAALSSFDLRKFDVLYHAYMIEMTLEQPTYEPLDALAEFADSYNLTPYYLRHKGYKVPESWQPTFFVLCVQAGLCKYVEHAIMNGASLNVSVGRPLLHYAVFPIPESLCQGRTDPFITTSRMVTLLVEYGADVHREYEGLTALAFAFEAYYGRKKQLSGSQHRVIEALLHAGASPECLIKETLPATETSLPRMVFVSPLQAAVHKDDRGTAELLLKLGANLNSLDEQDWKNLRKGELYGDVCPHRNPKSEKAMRWWKARETAIREGRNKKPMLHIVERYMNARPPVKLGIQSKISGIPHLTVEPVFGVQPPDNTRMMRPVSKRNPLQPDRSIDMVPPLPPVNTFPDGRSSDPYWKSRGLPDSPPPPRPPKIVDYMENASHDIHPSPAPVHDVRRFAGPSREPPMPAHDPLTCLVRMCPQCSDQEYGLADPPPELAFDQPLPQNVYVPDRPGRNLSRMHQSRDPQHFPASYVPQQRTRSAWDTEYGGPQPLPVRPHPTAHSPPYPP